MDNVNIFGTVQIFNSDNNLIFENKNEITPFGKMLLITSLFNPKNDKYIDGISILECANTNILKLNDLETYYNHTIISNEEIHDLPIYYAQIT